MSEIAAAQARNDEGRAALVRLLESQGIDINRVEYGPIEIEPVGDAFAIHFRSVLFVTPAELASAMQKPEGQGA